MIDNLFVRILGRKVVEIWVVMKSNLRLSLFNSPTKLTTASFHILSFHKHLTRVQMNQSINNQVTIPRPKVALAFRGELGGLQPLMSYMSFVGHASSFAILRRPLSVFGCIG